MPSVLSRRATLRWQLTITHIGVTLLVMLALQCLTIILLVVGLTAAGNPLAANIALIGPALPGLLALNALLFLTGGSATALLFGHFASRPLIERIQRLVAASAALAQGDLSQRVADPARDELGQLARQFDAMSGQLTHHVATVAAQQARLAVLEERQHLAHDLHDSVTQELFSLTLLVAATRNALEADPATAATLLDELDPALAQLLHETRSIIFALQPESAAQMTLTDALRALAATLSARQGFLVDLALTGASECLPYALARDLLLIAREALANAARHSGVGRASLTLAVEGNQALLVVEDAGCGFVLRSQPRTAIGFHSMAERAARWGGEFVLNSHPGGGTRVRIAIPLPASAPQTLPDKSHHEPA